MKTKFILVEWPESQYFIGHEECYLCEELDSAYFVPEEVYKEVSNITVTSGYIQNELFNLIETIRQSISKLLIDTSEENPKECHITLESSEDCGLSSLLLPTIIKAWHNPIEGWITFEFIGNYRKGFEELNIYEMLQVLSGLEDCN